MRKIRSILLLCTTFILLAFSLTGCGGKDQTSQNGSTGTTQNNTNGTTNNTSVGMVSTM